MTDRDTLLRLADLAWGTLCESLDDLTEAQSWASFECRPGEYMHTEGSILSLIAHVANGKIIYASVGFRDTEIRWRELSPKIDALWPHLDQVVAWLHEAHAYWLAAWRDVVDFEAERPRFNGEFQPGWKLIATGILHDQYHAGQIQLQRSILAPTATPPPPEGELWRTYCEKFACW